MEYAPGGARDAGLDLGYETQVKVLSDEFEDIALSSHANHSDLDYAASGHSGFASEGHVHTGGATQAAVAARVHNSGAFTVPTGANTVITFDSERYDTGGLHSTSADTSRFTITQTGYYHIGGSARWDTNTTNRRILGILLNGATIIAFEEHVPNASGVAHFVATDYMLSAGNYVELFAFQNSGGDRTLSVNANYSPEFWIHLIGT